jgi:hypothetical protein
MCVCICSRPRSDAAALKDWVNFIKLACAGTLSAVKTPISALCTSGVPPPSTRPCFFVCFRLPYFPWMLLPFGSVLCTLGWAAYIKPREGLAPAAKEGVVAKAGPDGRTFNPRRLVLSPATRSLVYFDPETGSPLVRGLLFVWEASLS